ncbi:MAG TPA: hypothetical protein VL461_02100 [Dictyobacter sp.]|nr:hypothetical protein [Dictyobacter sp.]
MPITRRRRANPPEQPENSNTVEQRAVEQSSEATAATDAAAIASTSQQASEAEGKKQDQDVAVRHADATSVSASREHATEAVQGYVPVTPPTPQLPNGERTEQRMGRTERDYTPSIEGGRRTARGELFRRPPQPPVAQPMPTPVTSAPLQAPSHEISLPLGNLLHLAYNPGYTGSDEARSVLLQQLANESKAGGRARCWSCGSLAIVYDRWNTRSKTFGEVGVAFCEICGVWSVM